MSRASADMFQAQLFQSRIKASFVERLQMARILEEQGIQQSALFDERTAVRVGRLVGARFIIIGKLAQAGEDLAHGTDLLLYQRKSQEAQVSLVVRIVNVETGVVEWAGEATVTGRRSSAAVLGLGTAFTYDERLLDLALRRAISELVERLTGKD